MQFTFHGAGREVGRSCIELDNTFLFDAGLKITEHGTQFPTNFDHTKIKALFLSHAHLDHTGALPLFNHQGMKCPIFSTRMTKLMTQVLLEDSFHIELITHTHPAYHENNIFNVLKNFQEVTYNKEYTLTTVPGTKFQFLDAGHIPGSASILLQYKGKTILYTGDVNPQTSKLLQGAHYAPKNVDIMITESTYGDRKHPDRKQTEERFISIIMEVLSKGGSVLLPSFAVGRAQELLILLSESKVDCPIYLDGMAKKVMDICISNQMFVRDAVALRKAQKRVRYITSPMDRKKVLNENSIIITTSGMVTGGPVMDYLKMMFFEPKHGLLLTGYQGDGTNGRLLLQEKAAFVDGKKVRWEGRIEQFDFSAHAGQDDLIAAVERFKPAHLIINHGDEVAMETLAEKVKPYAKKVYLPQIDETVEIGFA